MELDFFVSYTQADRAWAEWIAWQLEESGYRALIQAWDFVPGSNWVASMQEGVTGATRTVAVLSPAYLTSSYGSAEWQGAWHSDPSGIERKLLVVRVANCSRPGLLSQVVGIDLFDRDEVAAKASLHRMVKGAIEGRIKPERPPEFPGGPTITEPAEPRAFPMPVRFPGRGAVIWNVPDRNPNFVGRFLDLDKVRNDLTLGSSVVVQSVRGMGGVGKTQLATEFCHRYADAYELVWWFSSERPELLLEQESALARALGLDPPADPTIVRRRVHAALKDCGSWLLVFDNAEQPGDIRPHYPTDPRASDRPGHVLVTTRNTGFTSLGRVHSLDVVNTEEAVALMRTRVAEIAWDDAAAIARELGHLPLAVEQAAAYLEQSTMEPGTYVRMLRTRTADMLGKGRPANHVDTIATLWTVSLETVASKSPAAGQLLTICAYFAPEAIPLDLFAAHSDELPEPLATEARDELTFADTYGLVTDYSLAAHSNGKLTLHRLVQAALRARDQTTPRVQGKK